jgi:diguanylate cyclase (GGDEF)-like protein
MALDQTREITRTGGHVWDVENRFRRIFYGACFLDAVILVVLILAMNRIGHLQSIRIPLLFMMAWSLAVTIYAFHCLFVFALRMKKEIAGATFLDQTTGVFNRRYLEERLASESEHIRRYGGLTAILRLDLDHFQRVNDSRGLHVGNMVLREIARRLAKQLRACDALARWGDDAFVAVLPQTGRPQAELVAERLKKTVAAYELDLGKDDRVDFVRASIGLAVCPEDCAEIGGAVKIAGRAADRAKAMGGDTVCRASDRDVQESGEEAPAAGSETDQSKPPTPSAEPPSEADEKEGR